jgi:hypothetical protein
MGELMRAAGTMNRGGVRTGAMRPMMSELVAIVRAVRTLMALVPGMPCELMPAALPPVMRTSMRKFVRCPVRAVVLEMAVVMATAVRVVITVRTAVMAMMGKRMPMMVSIMPDVTVAFGRVTMGELVPSMLSTVRAAMRERVVPVMPAVMQRMFSLATVVMRGMSSAAMLTVS